MAGINIKYIGAGGKEFRGMVPTSSIADILEDDRGNAIIDYLVPERAMWVRRGGDGADKDEMLPPDDRTPRGGLVWMRTTTKYDTVVKAYNEATKGQS